MSSSVYTNYIFDADHEAIVKSYYGFYWGVYDASTNQLIFSEQGMSADIENTVTPDYNYFMYFSPYKISWSTEYTVN